jgi:hypothetical protein
LRGRTRRLKIADDFDRSIKKQEETKNKKKLGKQEGRKNREAI